MATLALDQKQTGTQTRAFVIAWGFTVLFYFLEYAVRSSPAVMIPELENSFHTTALGSMGFGIPAAIGACLGGGSRPTVCVDGDGGFQFNIQELETVKRLNLPIKFFVLNNEGYGSIRASQKVFFGETVIGCDEATGQTLPDVRKVAAAYGIRTDAG